MRKSNSDFIPNSVVRTHYKSMENSVRAGEKIFANMDLTRRERYKKIKNMCDNQDMKMINVMENMKDNYFKKNYSFKKIITTERFNSYGNSGKHMGDRYDPNDFIYPLHRTLTRKDAGQPYLY